MDKVRSDIDKEGENQGGDHYGVEYLDRGFPAVGGLAGPAVNPPPGVVPSRPGVALPAGPRKVVGMDEAPAFAMTPNVMAPMTILASHGRMASPWPASAVGPAPSLPHRRPMTGIAPRPLQALLMRKILKSLKVGMTTAAEESGLAVGGRLEDPDVNDDRASVCPPQPRVGMAGQAILVFIRGGRPDEKENSQEKEKRK